MSLAKELAEIPSIFDHPDRAVSRFITADGYRTHYIEAGDPKAPPVVLVHGHSMDIGMATDRWYPTILPLAEKLRVFAVDELGQGGTDAPRDPAMLGHIRVRAEHVIAFIEALNVGPVHLVGQSQGGWIVAYIAIRRPDLVRRMVLVDSASASASDQSKQGLPYFKEVFHPGTMMPKLDLSTKEGIRRYMSVFLYDKDAMIDPYIDRLAVLSSKWRDKYRQVNEVNWSEANRGHYSEQYTIDGVQVRDLVHKIKAPTLFVWGKQSCKPLEPGLEIYKKVEDAEMHIFDKAGHFVWLDQPSKFNALTVFYLLQ
jgi:pimeloyl-ACP methyl ester carboxylesterase